MTINSLLDLKKEIGQIVSNPDSLDFPTELIFNRGIEHSQFKITIEEIETEFFTDPKGRKWQRVKEKS